MMRTTELLRRIGSFLLAAVLCLSLCGMAVMASDSEADTEEALSAEPAPDSSAAGAQAEEAADADAEAPALDALAAFDDIPATGTPGWSQVDSRWVYYGTGGSRVMSGWIKTGQSWYYIRNGFMVRDAVMSIDGQIYSFGSDGVMQTGWVQLVYPGSGQPYWSYFNSDGSQQGDGWMKSGGKWFYFQNGRMAADTVVEVGGEHYAFGSDGVMLTGWVQHTVRNSDGSTSTFWSYYTSSGVRRDDGWYYINEKWYFFRDGVMLTGWQDIRGDRYLLNDDGTIFKGWKNEGGYWYYMDDTGVCRTGWKVVNGNTYYFYTVDDPNGGPAYTMATNTTIDGYDINGDGVAMFSEPRERMILDAQGYSSETPYLIIVDYEECLIGIFEGSKDNWEMIDYQWCSPGTYSTQTYRGIFSIYKQGYYFISGSAYCYYYSNFNGNQALHSILYYSDGSVMDGRLGYHLSHGCVRLATSLAKWIYNNCGVGTTVVVY